MSNLNFKNEEEFAAARQQFFENHPEAPVAKDIECLNLIMRREFAEEILRGTKKLEYRSYSEHYVKRLIDKDVYDYINMHIDDEEVVTFCNDIRQVKMIHFHNYNNSWFLDVECTFNDAFFLNDEGVKYLQDSFDCHDWDEELAQLNAKNEEMRPCIFFFVCGKVLGTDLKV